MIAIEQPESPTGAAAVRITTHFEARLLDIEQYWMELGNAHAFDVLVERLNTQIVPLLKRAPEAGRGFLDETADPWATVLATGHLSELLERAKSSGGALRLHAFGDASPDKYLLLYLFAGDTVYLLSIHRTEDSADRGTG
ncbi:hypothetical protein BKIR_c41_0721 [Candidatus Paraburkholderia kirkii UZHbot1]|uniref:Uncharacterized protein n=1 Tax=Candidatus Paraburkholderia kirkii UZHbot1 TaxID=1055526 RepID=G4MD69_9BURK|nr:hypothetical protein BKIR_c41_0721 [Candidatus Paraburkholderia kirkii UZHbot1]